eukprot:SAG31_NODE_167_length_21485_cov_31.094922_16_plen_220_part_00
MARLPQRLCLRRTDCAVAAAADLALRPAALLAEVIDTVRGKPGFNIDALDKAGRTAYIVACQMDNSAAVLALVEAGCDGTAWMPARAALPRLLPCCKVVARSTVVRVLTLRCVPPNSRRPLRSPGQRAADRLGVGGGRGSPRDGGHAAPSCARRAHRAAAAMAADATAGESDAAGPGCTGRKGQAAARVARKRGKDCYFLDFMGLSLLNLPCTHREIRG